MRFAKLFGEDENQILVKMDDGEDGPELRFYFSPANLGICNFALKFGGEDIEKSWSACETAFENTDEARARTLVAEIIKEMGLQQEGC